MNLTLTDRFSVEPFVTYGRRSSPAFDSAAAVVETQRTEGMYGVVVHQRLRSTTRSGFHAYLSYGLNGMHYKVTSPATRSQTVGMLFPSVGFGIRKSLGDHLAAAPTPTSSQTS